MGPRGITAEQIAYRDRVFGALVKTDEWKKDLQENLWDEGYADAKSTRSAWTTSTRNTKRYSPSWALPTDGFLERHLTR
jgi:tripartite-type tricarboxylate transporter receptor subunit TctC